MSKKFKVDARVILHLGRDSIKDHTTALIELIKNSYDADATKVEIEIYTKGSNPYIRVADNGFGMTEYEIDNHWLRIAYSEKRKSKMSQKGRRKTGEKGIGRISTDRIGANLYLATKADDGLKGIEVNWDDFDVAGREIEDIDIKTLKEPKINIPQKSNEISTTGTEIIIKTLRQKWTKENIDSLYNELSYLTTPFSEIEDFEIDLKTDIKTGLPEKIKSAYFDTAEIEINADYDGDENKIIYSIKNKYFPNKIDTEIIDINGLYTRLKKENDNVDKLRCGPFSLKYLFFPRKSSLLEGTNFTLTDLREFLDKNAGVKIYRDNISVKPYGYQNSPVGFDWLGLAERKGADPAGISRETYKVTPNQLLGGIFISRDKNPDIYDSASREGLLDNEALSDLKDVALGSIILLETYRYKLFQKLAKKTTKKETTINQSVDKVVEELILVKESLKKLTKESSKEESDKISQTIIKIESAIKSSASAFEKLLDEKRVLNGLATLGISTAVFGHETESAINNFKDAAQNARNYMRLTPPNVDIAIDELDVAYDQAKLIAGWGSFALTRVQYEKRVIKTKRVQQIIRNTLHEIKPALDASNIELILKQENIIAEVYQMNIESIILNLVTNAYNACLNGVGRRVIKVELISEHRDNIKGYELIVSDSGPGIPKEYKERIWEPLFTTTVGSGKARGGVGLGLTIVKSIVESLNGAVNASSDKELKGARFTVWLPREIN
ncbi:MAG: ATP-binding protein [Candidatus Delongbacteria bacterium]|nr:ATP-binding protein [Candidatus Delongbacteria bacterium]